MNNFSNSRKQMGIAAVEMVVVLPIFLLFLAVIIEFSNILINYSILTKQQNIGARYISEMYKYLDQDIAIDQGKNLIVYGNTVEKGKAVLEAFSKEQVNISIQNRNYVINISYPYQPIVFPTIPNFNNLSQAGISTEFSLNTRTVITRL